MNSSGQAGQKQRQKTQAEITSGETQTHTYVKQHIYAVLLNTTRSIYQPTIAFLPYCSTSEVYMGKKNSTVIQRCPCASPPCSACLPIDHLHSSCWEVAGGSASSTNSLLERYDDQILLLYHTHHVVVYQSTILVGRVLGAQKRRCFGESARPDDDEKQPNKKDRSMGYGGTLPTRIHPHPHTTSAARARVCVLHMKW